MPTCRFVLFEPLGGRAWRTRSALHRLLLRTRWSIARRGRHARPWKALIFLTALLAATRGFASFASAHTDNVTVIHLTTVDVESHLVDVAPSGGPPSLGDQLIFSENLFRDGRQVGFDTGVCTIARAQHPPGAFQCQATAYIGGDQLTAQGLAFDRPSNVFAITGGTGRWRNAGGQAVSREISQTQEELTFYISDLG